MKHVRLSPLCCLLLVATQVYGQADRGKSLHPPSLKQQAIGEDIGVDLFSSTFVKLTWESPLFSGQPELSDSTYAALQGGCELAGGAAGERTTVSMQFTDEQGDVAGGRPRVLSRPSLYGAAASLIEGTFAASAGKSGSLSFDVCIDFESDTEIVLELSVADAAGNPSRFISLPIINPALVSAGNNVLTSHRSWSVEPDAEHNAADYRPASYGLKLAHLTDSEAPYAHVVIDHSYIGDLVVRLGVGDPTNPSWVVTAHNREGGSDDDLILEVDLSGAAAYLPPSSSSRWFLEVSDEISFDDGEVTDFTIITQALGDPVPQIYSAGNLPQPVSFNSTTTILVDDSDHNARTAVVEFDYVLEEFSSGGVPRVSVQVGTAANESPLTLLDWEIERVESRPAGPGTMKLYLDVSEARVRLNEPQTWFLKANSFRLNLISGVVNTFTILTRDEAYTASDLPQPFGQGETPYITLTIPFDGPLVPAAFIAIMSDNCPDSFRLGVGDPHGPDWVTTPSTFHDCTYEVDLTEAAAFLPPSVVRPWFVEVHNPLLLRAFSIRVDDEVYYAPGLPLVAEPGGSATASISELHPAPELLGYRLLRGSDFMQTEVVADSIPPYATSYLDLTWTDDRSGGTYWILALYGYFDALGNPVDTFFDMVDGNPIFAEVGLPTESNGRGAIWGDFDKDGYPDLFVPRVDSANKLFRYNLDSLKLIEIPDWTGSDLVTDTHGGTWGDYDNDGDLDLFVPNNDSPSVLYKNRFREDGSIGFDVVNAGSLTSQAKLTQSAAWADYDCDGYVDLYLANWNQPNSLFRNEGNGMFSEIIGPWSATADRSNGSFWADYDNDGDQDLFVVNLIDAEPNRLYHNRLAESGHADFVLVLEDVFGTDKGRSTSASWGDYDNDGDLDLFVANELSPQNPSRLNWLYRNDLDDGHATFERIHATSPSDPIVNTVGKSNSSAWADFDNDGDLDLFSTIEVEAADPGSTCRSKTIGGICPLIYLNTTLPETSGRSLCRAGDDSGTFCRPTRGNADDYESGLRGLAFADLNRDGLLDLVISDGDSRPSLSLLNRLGVEQTSGHWITVRLEGSGESNRAAIGARVTLHASIDGVAVEQTREVSSLTGTGGQSDLAMTFGLGSGEVIDSIVVRWPRYPLGAETVLYAVPVDTFLVIGDEIVGDGVPSDHLPLEVELRQNYPNPFSQLTTISYALPAPSDVRLTLVDMLGRRLRLLASGLKPRGRHDLQVDASQLASGVYLFRLESGDFVETKRMVVVK